MAKTVFSPASMVAHVWAQQTQDTGRSSNGNFRFIGPDLYHYSALIAKFVTAANGERVALLTARSWPATTSKHQSLARNAVIGKGFTVPDIGNGASAPDHAANLAYLVKTYRDGVASLKRKRDIYDYYTEHATSEANTAQDYAAAFGLPDPGLTPEQDIEEVKAHHKARYSRLNTPEAIAKREKDKERREATRIAREERQRQATIEANSQAIAEWLTGERRHLPYDASYDSRGGAILRVSGDKLQTSQGVEVPLNHAIRVFRRVAACREAQKEWRTNGETIRVGHFEVTQITEDGTLIAGCHTIYWPEIERIARIVGVLEPARENNLHNPSENPLTL
jgi:hypothetical protein